MENCKKEFLQNYRGNLDPEEAYRQHSEIEKAKELYGDATYSEAQNIALLREAVNRIRKGGKA
jgi:uncharacterized protein YaiL (DUF2058 family)